MGRFATLLAVLLFAASGAHAQTPGSCALGTAEGDLDVSNVFARVFNTGSLFFGNATTNGDGYLVPRFSNHSPLFAAGIWLGGYAEGELRVAGSRYTNFNFYPGPLNEDGTLPDADDCSAFDRIYVVSTVDVDRYEASGEASADLAAWPVGLGAPAVDASGQPLAATSREQVLDLGAGERPVIYGSQTAWWVMNDVGAPHLLQDTPPLGVEVRVSAFAISGEGDAVAGTPEATFYRYEIVNRSANEITGLRAGFFTDPDLGDAADDYIATDTTRSLAIVYNDIPTDGVYGIPPALGIDLLNGAGASSWFIGGASATTTGDPVTGEQMYNVLQGLWSGGSRVREFGDGYGQPETYPVTPFVLAGDPVTGSFWSEENIDGEGTNNPAGDRRMVITAPPSTLASGASRTVDLAVLFAQGTDRFDSVTELRAVSDEVQDAYDAGTLWDLGADLTALATPQSLAPEAGAPATQADSVVFSWTPVGGASGYQVRWGFSPDSLFNTQQSPGSSLALRVEQLTRIDRRRSRFGIQEVFWSVRPLGDGGIGEYSEPRSVFVYREGPLMLASGALAFIEVAGPGGADPCAESAQSRDGCDETGGNLVYRSLNSTGAYYFASTQEDFSAYQIGPFAPNDYEIRFTRSGGLASCAPFCNGLRVRRVPFEVWDVGAVALGEENDPSDDVQLLPTYRSDMACEFGPIGGFNVRDPDFPGYVFSDRIGAAYPVTTYADFEAEYAPLVEAAPDGCFEETDGERFQTLFDVDRLPVYGYLFGSPEAAPALPEAGTVIRLYTADPPPVSGEPTPGASGEIALTVAPNPARGAATVRLALTAPEAVRVRVLDMLGREVATLAEGPQASGDMALRLPGDLASGVYAVEAVAGERRMTRLVTVVR
ncbi:T9SS type A sorting domain-containing protein [Rubricoccus marinus]|uniref:Secretion system C-terminal sorting domain-containing protein n=1 Tax=Rubricoccus marinus TaxID=716817 RepID=A0A259U3H0_9BACT|nr:T9SS type A sorting domain-containing protein [Rubricoccus marinus]OZC04397.1 hypothetical protein BSZ36_16265 [Rubricoccus marinus]